MQAEAPPFTLSVTSPVIYWLRGLIVHAPNIASIGHLVSKFPLFQPLFKGTTVEALKEVRVCMWCVCVCVCVCIWVCVSVCLCVGRRYVLGDEGDELSFQKLTIVVVGGGGGV